MAEIKIFSQVPPVKAAEAFSACHVGDDKHEAC